MNPVIKILVKRDKLTVAEAREAISECRELILEDIDSADDIIREELGLEPDYLFDII